MPTPRRPASAKNDGDVDALVRELKHPREAEIAALREVIRGAHPSVVEGVKWNSPSFRVDDYFATLNLRQRDGVLVVLHRGAKAKNDAAFAEGFPDPTTLLTWMSPDRATVALRDMADVEARRDALAAVIHAWVERL